MQATERSAPLLECAGLTKAYASGMNALNNLTLTLPAGRIIGLLGPNGSGKTTLIKLIAGLLTPTAGFIKVCGVPVSTQTKTLVSYLPERSSLDESMKVREAITYYSEFFPDFDVSRAEEMLASLGVDGDKVIRTLSKGTREKVQLVLVMSRRARLYLLDEPIGGVDPAARDFILRTIISNYSEDATVLISTHLIRDVEQILDEFIFLSRGEIVNQGSVDNIRAEYGVSLDEIFRRVFRC